MCCYSACSINRFDVSIVWRSFNSGAAIEVSRANSEAREILIQLLCAVSNPRESPVEARVSSDGMVLLSTCVKWSVLSESTESMGGQKQYAGML